MIDIWINVGIIVVLLLLGAVFFGAPYVPTRQKDVKKLFELINKKGVLVDLGSGDGRLVRAAAERGMKAYGIELSPILALMSWLSLGKLRRRVSIKWGNYWRMELPVETTVVFVFLADPFMDKLRVYLEAEALRLGRELTLVSYGFELPGYRPVKTKDALLMYKIKP